ncbi:MAG: alpha/beta hydrolase [Vulcanimicrobiaceae bacterium]
MDIQRLRRPRVKVTLHRIEAESNGVAVLEYEPRRPRGASLVVGHGYSSSKHNLDVLCGFLSSHGFAVYSLDFPGHKLGASGGTLRGMDDCIDAMGATVGFARKRRGAPVYAVGHSMGAITALLTAAQDERIAGVVAIATGYGRPTAMTALMAAGATDFRSSYVEGVALPELIAGIDIRYDGALGRLAGRPALYVAASRDAMVNVQSVRELYVRAPEPKVFATIDSDHTFAGENARGEVLQWLNALHPKA